MLGLVSIFYPFKKNIYILCQIDFLDPKDDPKEADHAFLHEIFCILI